MKDWKTEEIIGLVQAKGINTNQIRDFIEKYGSLDELCERKPYVASKLAQKNIFNKKTYSPFDFGKQQVELCEKYDIKIISYWDEQYPRLLKQIHYPPVILYVKGELQSSDAKPVSIVGTRAATTYGRLATERFVEYFVKYNLIIVSGLARGIDTKVHLETIKNKGITYAIIASGIDCINPAISNKNAEKIIESGGAVISEYPCGTKAMPGYFPQRNRIISGISIATLVIESAEKGGSLITAKFAFDQGRDVFAVPGNIFSEKSAGTNSLIASDIAAMAKSPEYVLNDLGIADAEKIKMFRKEQEQKLDNNEKVILDLLNHEPRHIDEIADKTEADINEVLVTLLKLEFKGLITQLPGKHYIKI